MLDRWKLAQALSRRPLAGWVVAQHDEELHEAGARARSEQRTRLHVVAHADTPTGRGTGRIDVDATEGDADAIADRAVALASAVIGPAWETPPAAAPARVELADPAFGDDLAAIAAKLVAPGAIAVPPGAHVTATARVVRDRAAIATHQGFHAEWQATLARVELVAGYGNGASARSLAIARSARRIADLYIDDAVADAVADLKRLAAAPRDHRLVGGPCAVVLGPDALLHDPPGADAPYRGLGVWAAFAAQADAALALEGLARFHERAPIAAGADQLAEPLTIASDGALEYGVRSAPIGDDGDAVRRFALVERGVAGELGLSPREAALRGRDPNGGVRNLVVAVGSWDGAIGTALPGARSIEVRRLRDLAIDPFTGEASLEIALGIERIGDTAVAFAGGTLRVDLIAALAHARRARAEVARGPYRGPASVLIERAELLA